MPFDKLGLKAELVCAVSAQGYARSTPMQAKTIALLLDGRDVLARAQTGTGKTAACTLPLLQRLSDGSRPGRHPRALILNPDTRVAIPSDRYGKLAPSVGLHAHQARCNSVGRTAAILGNKSLVAALY